MKEEILQYTSLAKFLKEALGERYAVSLIDAEDLQQCWRVEDRSLVQAAPDGPSDAGLLADILNSGELKNRDYLCSFSESGEQTPGIKNSVFYIRNQAGDLIGFLSLQETESTRVTVREVVNQLLEPVTDEPIPVGSTSRRISAEVDSLVRERITESWNRYTAAGKKLKKADKLAFILELMEAGIFRMKGAAVQVSEVTGMSQASIYRYLSEVVEE